MKKIRTLKELAEAFQKDKVNAIAYNDETGELTFLYEPEVVRGSLKLTRADHDLLNVVYEQGQQDTRNQVRQVLGIH